MLRAPAGVPHKLLSKAASRLNSHHGSHAPMSWSSQQWQSGGQQSWRSASRGRVPAKAAPWSKEQRELYAAKQQNERLKKQLKDKERVKPEPLSPTVSLEDPGSPVRTVKTEEQLKERLSALKKSKALLTEQADKEMLAAKIEEAEAELTSTRPLSQRLEEAEKLLVEKKKK